MVGTVKNSSVENEIPTSGGRGEETIEEIRQKMHLHTLVHKIGSNKKRLSSKYTTTPQKIWWSWQKSYVTPDGELDNNSPSSILNSPNNLRRIYWFSTTIE